MSSQKGAPSDTLHLFFPRSLPSPSLSVPSSLSLFVSVFLSLPGLPMPIYLVLFSASLSERVVKRGRAFSVFLFPPLPPPPFRFSFILFAYVRSLGLVHPPADVERKEASLFLHLSRAFLADFVDARTRAKFHFGIVKARSRTVFIN